MIGDHVIKNSSDLNQFIRDSLIKLIDGEGNYQCVPMQGSGRL